MVDYQQIYKSKLMTPGEIASKVEDNMSICSSIAAGESVAINKAIGKRLVNGELKGIKYYASLSLKMPMIRDVYEKSYHRTLFVLDPVRPLVWEGKADFVPAFFFSAIETIQNTIQPDVFYCVVSPMDKHGYFSFGLSQAEIEGLRKARRIFLEVNKNMPRIHGDNFIHINEISGLCEDDSSMPVLPTAEITAEEKVIGENIAMLIEDGSCLQLGIGGIPNAAARAFKNRKFLGIHTEMFTESMVDLIESGIVDNSRKNVHRGKTICTFSFGTKKSYDFLDDNPSVEFYPATYVNDPRIIGSNDNVVSVNSCVEIDLFGQICAESIGPKQYSGVGGQSDFIRGSSYSKNGKSIIAIQSAVKGNTISKIKPVLTAGSIVTTTRNDVDYIITEFGIARMKTKSLSHRAKSLIGIAHPDFREELTFEAKKMCIM